MPIARRALLIGLLGPGIQALGFTWEISHLLLFHLHNPMDPRHLFFEGGVLLIGAGFLVSLVCIPVALEVARATEDDVALKVFGPEPAEAVDVRASHRAARATK